MKLKRNGSISFERFMDLALYAPDTGYYTRPQRDPFGMHGDFYTAEQLQPVFGILVSQLVRPLLTELGADTVVELGAGRGDMTAAFQALNYLPVEARSGALPERFQGVVFANEFFDAHPVHLLRRENGRWGSVHVTDQPPIVRFRSSTESAR